MCLGMELKSQEDRIIGAIEAYRDTGTSESDIISKIMEKYNVTKEYVLALLTPKTA